MKTISSSLVTKFQDSNIELFALVEIQFDTNPLYYTTLPYDVTIGSKTYLSGSVLMNLESPKISNILDREGYRLQLLDNGNTLQNRWEAATGTPMEVFLGADRDTSDTVKIYRGRIDGVNYGISPGSNRKIATIQGSSPFADLDSTNLRMTLNSQQQVIDSADTSYANVNRNSRELSLYWGKDGVTTGQGAQPGEGGGAGGTRGG